MKARVALAVSLAALCFSCAQTRPLTLRFDPSQRAVETRHLEGVRVAVHGVRDGRDEKDLIGRHRDGLLRVTQYRYVARAPIEKTVEAALQMTLREAGATVVDATAPADISLEIDILALDVTTDAPLAGEETFGEVALEVHVSTGTQLVARLPVAQKFGDDEHQDAGLMGDALHRVLGSVVQAIRRGDRLTAR